MSYALLAPIYDQVMQHVEYGRWIDLIRKVVQRHLPGRPITVFEIGGGTGSLGVKLVEEGYLYIGSDLSVDMVRYAANKTLAACVADGRSLPVNGPFDLVLFLYDGINYLSTLDDFAKVFEEVYRVLAPGGCFLFDVTTEANSFNNFLDYYDSEDMGDLTYIRHSLYDPEKREQFNNFSFFIREEDGRYRRESERHVQYVFKPEEIASVVPHSLAIEGIWHGFGTSRYTSRSERIHFLLRKKA